MSILPPTRPGFWYPFATRRAYTSFLQESAQRESSIGLDGARPFNGWNTLSFCPSLSPLSLAALARPPCTFYPLSVSSWPKTRLPSSTVRAEIASSVPIPRRHGWHSDKPTKQDFAIWRAPSLLPYPQQGQSEDRPRGSACPDCQGVILKSPRHPLAPGPVYRKRFPRYQ